MMMRLSALILPIILLAGCQTAPQTLKEIGNAPAMSPIGSGLQFSQTPQMGSYPKQPKNMASGYSLWNDNQSALFKDLRALNIGDILTVNIRINDRADFANESERSRVSEKGVDWQADAEIFGWKPNANSSMSIGSDSDSVSNGKIKRSERLTLLVAAVVTGVLDNGNLLISGSQEVRVNQELRILNVAGIVRPQDVSSDNMISYERIAEARISYGGRGRIMEIQQPPIGHQIVDLFSPI